MPKLMFQDASSSLTRAPSRRRGLSWMDVLVGLTVIFVTICFALATKRDMMSAEAPSAPAPVAVVVLR